MGAPSAYNVFALTANEVFTQIIVGFGNVMCGGQMYSALCSIDVTSNQRHVGSTDGGCSGVVTTTVHLSAGLAYIGGRTDNGCITGLAFYYYN
jgi:hypothetical protein